MKQAKMQLYNFKCWNWNEPKQYTRYGVFAINEELALVEVKVSIKRDEYVLFEVFDHDEHTKLKLKEFA